MATTWDEWKQQATPLAVGGLDVATYDLGPADGTLLTFLHGYPSSSHDVEPVLERLDDGWRVLTLDFPGFGASDKPDGGPYAIHRCADAVEALWRAEGVERTLVLAHDYGVSPAQELLARQADGALGTGIDGVVWTNGGVYPDLHRPTAGQAALLDPEGGPALAAALDRDLFLAGVEVTWGTRTPMDRALVGEIYASMADGGGVALMHQLLHYVADRREHGDRWRGALEGATVPMAFVWGDLDPVSGAHMVERIEQQVTGPNVEISRLPDVGHWPPLEAPEEVAQAVRGLGRSVEPAGG
jgi:pimeloyl-ACP methyl ester carboxylesterase